jgi:hypothetical protein
MKIAWPLCAGLLTATTVWGADAAPAGKQAFSALPAIYASIEITETGAKEFGGVAKDSLTDGAHHYTRTAKFEVPLNMAMPGACPLSTMSVTPTAGMEEGRCIGWMSAPPDDAATEAMLTSGKVDMSKSAMFLPVEYSIDDVAQFRYRDTPADGFATETTTSKGKGLAYIARSGMVMCDLKSMTCDLNNVVLSYNSTDVLNVTKTSDVPGFETKKETVGPELLIPKIPDDVAKTLAGFAITLPVPITKALSGSLVDGTVSVKMTLSAKPAGKAAKAPR